MPKPVILVVDDEPLIRWALKEHLLQAGFEVKEAETGKAALANFGPDHDGIAAAVLDYRLPDMNGVEILKEIKKFDPGCQVILMSAHGTADVIEEARKKGAFHFAPKPFDYLSMVELVRKALGKAS